MIEPYTSKIQVGCSGWGSWISETRNYTQECLTFNNCQIKGKNFEKTCRLMILLTSLIRMYVLDNCIGIMWYMYKETCLESPLELMSRKKWSFHRGDLPRQVAFAWISVTKGIFYQARVFWMGPGMGSFQTGFTVLYVLYTVYHLWTVDSATNHISPWCA